MKPRLSLKAYEKNNLPNKIAGHLLLLSSLPFFCAWCIVLFVVIPDGITPIESAISTLQYLFSAQEGYRLWFTWFAAVPICCIGLGTSYLTNCAKSRTGAVTLLILSWALGISVLVLHEWAFAVIIFLSSIWGFRCVRR